MSDQIRIRQTIVTWYTPEEKEPPIDRTLVFIVTGSGEDLQVEHAMVTGEWWGNDFAMFDGLTLREYTVDAWCDLESPFPQEGKK